MHKGHVRPSLSTEGTLTHAQRKLVNYQFPRDLTMLLTALGIVLGVLEETCLSREVTSRMSKGVRPDCHGIPILSWFDHEHGFMTVFSWNKGFYQCNVFKSLMIASGWRKVTSHGKYSSLCLW